MSAVVATERRAALPWVWIAAATLAGLAVWLQVRFGMMAVVAWLIDCVERLAINQPEIADVARNVDVA